MPAKDLPGLLGSYNSQLTPAYYQQLLKLLNDAISAGDLSVGSAFDKTSLLALEQQAQDFSQLPTGNSGSRVTDESFNYPLGLLAARAAALAAEVASFTTVSGRLLDVLRNETDLVDDLLAADSLAEWTTASSRSWEPRKTRSLPFLGQLATFQIRSRPMGREETQLLYSLRTTPPSAPVNGSPNPQPSPGWLSTAQLREKGNRWHEKTAFLCLLGGQLRLRG
jgi:hypothetical protein